MAIYIYNALSFLAANQNAVVTDSDFKIIVVNQLDNNYQKKKLDFFLYLWFP